MDEMSGIKSQLANALDDLRRLQGRNPNRERALAITKIEEAIHWLEASP